MQKTAANINCPNPDCQTPNDEKNNFCSQCSSRIPKRYLWAVSKERCPSTLSDGRYIRKADRIFLDAKPGEPPEAPPDEIPSRAVPYLRLFPYRLHVPQAYALVSAGSGSGKSILLLEKGPIDISKLESAETDNPLLPELTKVWKQASVMRQLNWLWQIAQLWKALSNQNVAPTLLEENLLRCRGPLLCLLELKSDQKSLSSLKNLGKLWSKWAPDAQPEIAEFLKKLSSQLSKEQLEWQELRAQLDYALAHCSAVQSVQCQIATLSDKGPTRGRNEDACYPSSGKVLKPADWNNALTIVCDGIGGHEGGNVASNLAIDTIGDRVNQLAGSGENRSNLYQTLDQAIRDANDRISDRNDNEDRQDRQRMGTTVVMTVVQDYETYIAHVGDSRVYWITEDGCHQVTLDDDIASREVSLGYAFYWDALQQITSGSLIQALGMSPSQTLHPTVGRLILESDCVFLLCSDGLSDNDRVEEHWRSDILPIIQENADLAKVAKRLVDIANNENGHDNVTVGLVYCQVQQTERVVQPLTALGTSAQLSPFEDKAEIWQASLYRNTVRGRPEKSDLTGATTSIAVKDRIQGPRYGRWAARLAGILILIAIISGGIIWTYLKYPSFRKLVHERSDEIISKFDRLKKKLQDRLLPAVDRPDETPPSEDPPPEDPPDNLPPSISN
ncbi:MAG: protein phosphatase 2C domain-containing protein [Hormoscilla sp. SP5CHS1]|nr:protein phosphatase 2C domain-containing protein [Hormoscilla sp. SP5CHS1]